MFSDSPELAPLPPSHPTMTTSQLERNASFLLAFPLDIWLRIFDYACLDDGTTARSLSRTSRAFREASRRHRFRSVAIHGWESLLRFESLFCGPRDPEEVRKERAIQEEYGYRRDQSWWEKRLKEKGIVLDHVDRTPVEHSPEYGKIIKRLFVNIGPLYSVAYPPESWEPEDDDIESDGGEDSDHAVSGNESEPRDPVGQPVKPQTFDDCKGSREQEGESNPGEEDDDAMSYVYSGSESWSTDSDSDESDQAMGKQHALDGDVEDAPQVDSSTGFAPRNDERSWDSDDEPMKYDAPLPPTHREYVRTHPTRSAHINFGEQQDPDLSSLLRSASSLSQLQYRVFLSLRRILDACAPWLEDLTVCVQPAPALRIDFLFPILPSLRTLGVYEDRDRDDKINRGWYPAQSYKVQPACIVFPYLETLKIGTRQRGWELDRLRALQQLHEGLLGGNTTEEEGQEEPQKAGRIPNLREVDIPISFVGYVSAVTGSAKRYLSDMLLF